MVSGANVQDAYEKVASYYRSRGFGERPFLRKAVEEISKLGPDERIFIVAPTGYGKTSISMALSIEGLLRHRKTIVSYPLRSLIEDQVKRFREAISSIFGIDRGFGESIVGISMMGQRESPYLVHPIVLTTIDTLAFTALGASPEDLEKIFKGYSEGHYMFSWASIWGYTSIAMDEVHLVSDSTKSISFLVAFLSLSKEFDAQVILMTATMPESYLKAINKHAGVRVKVSRYRREHDTLFYDERESKRYGINLLELSSENKFEKLLQILRESRFEKTALVVFNTVDDAVNFYCTLKKRAVVNSANVYLIHSRFTPEDRRKKVEEMLRDSGRKVVVATQVVEAGLDITSDLIITEIAPLNSLIQRFGRFLRRSGEKCVDPGKCAYIWYDREKLEKSRDQYTVYDKTLVKSTVDIISSSDDLNLHIGYEELLDKVYREEPEVDRDYVNKLVHVFTSFTEPSEKIIDIVLEKEGSLVRDGLLITIRTANGYELAVDWSFVKKYCIDRSCPKKPREAVMDSLKGVVYSVNMNYDSELGLVEGCRV